MKLPPGVDGWGAGHGEDVFVAVPPKGLGPGVGVDTSGVVVVPGQLVGVEPNVLVLVLLLLPKIVLEVLLLPNIVLVLLLVLNIVLLLLLLNIVLLLLLLLLNIVLLLLMVDATGELKLLLLLRAS